MGAVVKILLGGIIFLELLEITVSYFHSTPKENTQNWKGWVCRHLGEGRFSFFSCYWGGGEDLNLKSQFENLPIPIICPCYYSYLLIFLLKNLNFLRIFSEGIFLNNYSNNCRSF